MPTKYSLSTTPVSAKNYLPIEGGTLTSDLSVSGTISATGNITAYSSDARLKTDVVPISDALTKLSIIGGYSYSWDMPLCDELGFKPEQLNEHGVLAQEIQKVLPDAVAPAPFDNEYLTVRYERIVPLLIAAIKELTDKVTALEAAQ